MISSEKPTRDTHARIYQGELSEREYKNLETMAMENGISVRDLILEKIKKYLEAWGPKSSLEIEEVLLNEKAVRFYLWFPYTYVTEMEHLMKEKGAYIQDLTKKAIAYSDFAA